jgi:hypothetical protein
MFTLGIAKNAHPLVATPVEQGFAALEDYVATPSTPTSLRNKDCHLSPPHSHHASFSPHLSEGIMIYTTGKVTQQLPILRPRIDM